jgi:hypothetical protein
MDEGGTIITVGSSTRLLHALGHSWWTTREDSDLGKMIVFFLEIVKELDKVWSSKVSDCLQPSEEGSVGDLLEVTLTNVLKGKRTMDKVDSTQGNQVTKYSTLHSPTWLFEGQTFQRIE